MAVWMVVIVLLITSLFSSLALADTNEVWRDKITADLQKKDTNLRITFGQVEITESEASAIEEAKTIARADMAKTFKLKIKTDSIQESSFSQSTNKADSKKIYSASNTKETTEEVDLTGLDFSKYSVDAERNTVIVAAILNLVEFEKYLIAKIQSKSLAINSKSNNACESIKDLSQIRQRLKLINEANKYEELLITFAKSNLALSKLIRDEKEKAVNCRAKFKISTSKVEKEIRSEVNKAITDMGFNVGENQKISIEIKTTKLITKPEVKFNQINILGKVEIELIISNALLTSWKSKTIRQTGMDENSAKMKLDVRINDELLKGLITILEENL